MATTIYTLESGLKYCGDEPLSGAGGQALTDNFQILNDHILGSGYQHLLNMRMSVSGTGTLTTTPTGHGECYINPDATYEVAYQLPLASSSSGVMYSFINDHASGTKVVANENDQIYLTGGISDSGGYLYSKQLGDTLNVMAFRTNQWATMYYTGDWSIDSQ